MAGPDFTRRSLLGRVVSTTTGLAAAAGATGARGSEPADDGESPLAYTDVEERESVVEVDPFFGTPPTGRQRRTLASVVGHTGARPVPGVADEVQYTVVVSTSAASVWIDENDDVQGQANEITRVETEIYFPEAGVRPSFPADEDWVGARRLVRDDDEGPIEEIAGDNDVVEAALTIGWELLTTAVPFLGTISDVVSLAGGMVDLFDDDSKHVATFELDDGSPESAVITYRKFHVQMDRSGTAEFDFRTGIRMDDADQRRVDFEHTLVLDPEGALTDVEGHPFEYAIRTLVDEGVIAGYEDGTFRPEQRLTRAEFASMLVEAFELDPDDRPDFADVEGHWAAAKIRTAAGAGFLSGYPDGTFRPDEGITKVAVIVALASGLGYDDGDPSALSETYEDADEIPDWARAAVASAHAEWGVIESYPSNTQLDPTRDATRAEAAKYVFEAFRGRTATATTGTGDDVWRVTGRLASGERDDYRYAVRSEDPRSVRVTLDGPADADLDLYVTLDGRRATREDHDRSARSFGSDEDLTIDGERIGDDATLGFRVVAHSSGGRYDLAVSERV